MVLDANTPETPLLMPRPAAARLLGVSQDVLLRMVERGLLEQVVLGPGMHPRIRRADIEALARGDQPAAEAP